MLLRGDIAEHRASIPANLGGTNCTCDVIIARSDISRQRAEGVKRSLVAPIELLVHILLDKLHRDMPGAFVHDLNIKFPRSAG